VRLGLASSWARCEFTVEPPATVWLAWHVALCLAAIEFVIPSSQSEWLTADEAALYLKLKTTRCLLRLVRLGTVRAYALSGTKRHVWRFRKEDLDTALLAKPVVSCESLPVRSGKGATI
jgi:excisionase family DNA binding protein